MNIKPNTDTTLANKPLINIGALFDIPTGSWFTGPKGESILNGGVSSVEGIVGAGNNFKSTIMHYMMLQAANRMNATGILTPMHTYDTEDNMYMNIDRVNELAKGFEYIPDEPLNDPDVWSLISKSEMPAEEWIKKVYKVVKEKKENKDKYFTYHTFISRLTKKPIELPIPSFIEIDSFTEFEPSSTIEAIEKDIENSNTVFMHQGLFKTKVLKDLPRLSNTGNIYFFLTAHLGKEIQIPTGPFGPHNTKSLQYLKQGDKIKGVSDKLYFLTTHLWYAHMSKALINQNTKMPEYPINEDDVETDLNIVRLTQLRSKSGPSGYTLEIIVSQREGVLPSLTEFHFIKTNKYGLDGSVRSYWLDLYPDVKLSRTTVRNKIDEDYRLRRAIQITAELLQMKKFQLKYKHLYVEPKQLREDLEKIGYDWNQLLDTRSWWTIENYKDDLKPYLSTMDLLKMRVGEYKPYWLKKEKGEVNE